MKAHLVLYVEIEEPNAEAWFNVAARIIEKHNRMYDDHHKIIHAETIDREIDISGAQP